MSFACMWPMPNLDPAVTSRLSRRAIQCSIQKYLLEFFALYEENTASRNLTLSCKHVDRGKQVALHHKTIRLSKGV